MYLHVELKTVPTNRQTEAIDRLTRLHRLMAAAPGFHDAHICAYLGDPARYLITRTWQDAAAHAAYRASPAQREYAQNRPAVLPWENTAVQEWESILVSDGSGSGNYVVRTLYDVAQGRGDDFLEDRRRHDSLQSQAGGLIYVRSYRPLNGAPETAGQALVLERYADRRAYNRYLESAERAEYERHEDSGISQPKLIECYEVVRETRRG